MSKLIVAAYRSGRGQMGFVLSPHQEKQKALDVWREDGLEVITVEEVSLSRGAGDTLSSLLRTMAETPDGAETLSSLLEGAVAVFMQWKSGRSR